MIEKETEQSATIEITVTRADGTVEHYPAVPFKVVKETWVDPKDDD